MNSKEPKVISVNISTATFIKIVVLVLLLLFLFLIKEVLVILFAAIIFAAALEPSVSWLHKRKIPRTISILLIYLVVIALLVLTVRLLIPPVVEQVQGLYTDFPVYSEKIATWFSEFRDYSAESGFLDNVGESLQGVENVLVQTASNLFSGIMNFFGGVISVLLVAVITFYILVKENAMKRLVWSIAPSQYQPYILQLLSRMQKKIGAWLRGQLILCLIIGLMAFVGLWIAGVPYALILALIAGLGEFVPFIGTIVTSVPAILIAFTQSPYLALFVVVWYVIIQQVEGSVIVPKLMQKAVGLHPIVSITVLLIGFKLGGVVGALLAIPVATAVGVFLGDIFGERKAAMKEVAEEKEAVVKEEGRGKREE